MPSFAFGQSMPLVISSPICPAGLHPQDLNVLKRTNPHVGTAAAAARAGLETGDLDPAARIMGPGGPMPLRPDDYLACSMALSRLRFLRLRLRASADFTLSFPETRI